MWTYLLGGGGTIQSTAVHRTHRMDLSPWLHTLLERVSRRGIRERLWPVVECSEFIQGRVGVRGALIVYDCPSIPWLLAKDGLPRRQSPRTTEAKVLKQKAVAFSFIQWAASSGHLCLTLLSVSNLENRSKMVGQGMRISIFNWKWSQSCCFLSLTEIKPDLIVLTRTHLANYKIWRLFSTNWVMSLVLIRTYLKHLIIQKHFRTTTYPGTANVIDFQPCATP